MGDGWVLLVDETWVNRAPPTSCRPPRCALAAGDPRLPPAAQSLVLRGDSGSAQGSRLCQLKGSWGERMHAWGRGGETDDFIFFEGDSQFVHLLITRAPELGFDG